MNTTAIARSSFTTHSLSPCPSGSSFTAARFIRVRLAPLGSLILLVGIFASENLHAATRYVRAGAAGNGNGNDWTNAYPTLPAPATLVRGDTYYIASGTYGGYTFSTAVSGTTPIIIKKATIADHGTSIGWHDSYGTGPATFTNTLTFATSYWVFDGQTRATPKSGYGFVVDLPSRGRGIFLSSANIGFITLQYVDIPGNGPDGGGNPGLADDAIYSLGPNSGLSFRYMYIHDQGRVPFLLRAQTDLLVEYCVIARNETHPLEHSEAVALFGGGPSIRCTFRYNIFEDIEGTGVIIVGGATNGAPATDCEFYGNIFYWTSSYPNPGQDGSYVGHGVISSQSFEVHSNSLYYNNTVIIPASGGVSFRMGSLGVGTGNRSRNNIFFAYGPIGTRLGNVPTTTRDSNLYNQNGAWTVGDANARTDLTGSVFVDPANYDFRTSPLNAKVRILSQ